ncbi:MAG: hypothetical protein NVSMB46_03330 [Candidatus Saccharimonadales bacterium]
MALINEISLVVIDPKHNRFGQADEIIFSSSSYDVRLGLLTNKPYMPMLLGFGL